MSSVKNNSIKSLSVLQPSGMFRGPFLRLEEGGDKAFWTYSEFLVTLLETSLTSNSSQWSSFPGNGVSNSWRTGSMWSFSLCSTTTRSLSSSDWSSISDWVRSSFICWTTPPFPGNIWWWILPAVVTVELVALEEKQSLLLELDLIASFQAGHVCLLCPTAVQ